MKVKIGVIGAGHLGKIHLRLLREAENCDLTGFFDHNPELALKVQEETGVHSFSSEDELIRASDAVDIVTPTLSHYEIACRCLKQSKHIFIEKPVTETLPEGRDLIRQIEGSGLKVQVGHVERFNPAFAAARKYLHQPMFIETHRLAEFNPRGTDVSVVLDLMIHDIDIVLSVVNSPVRKVSASGVAVVSDSPDIANARIEFENGCVANLTASRISLKKMRKSRFFQRDAYISVDFLSKSTEIIRLKALEGEPGPLDITISLGENKGSKRIYFDQPEIKDGNAIKTELELFAASILHDTPCAVSVVDGVQALDVAQRVMEKLNASLNVLA